VKEYQPPVGIFLFVCFEKCLFPDFAIPIRFCAVRCVLARTCSKSDVVPVFEALIRDADFQYIFLSYNNEGLMSVGQVREIFECFGKYNLVQTEYRRFKADKTENRNHKANSIFEYLHILEKTFYSGLTKTSTALPRLSS
ncbi:TPA: hypothetical protein ACJJSH_002184, partial [Neisseria meningitidis]